MNDPIPEEPSAATPTRCCCSFPCFGSRRSFSYSVSSTSSSLWDTPHTPPPGSLRARSLGALKKVREWSEIIAGPKWKTFIRRFNRSSRSSSSAGRFQYDPLSYALNFDEGPHADALEDLDSSEFAGFSSPRYAASSGSSNSFLAGNKEVAVTS